MTDEQVALDFTTNAETVIQQIIAGFDQLEARAREMGAMSAGADAFTEMRRQQQALAEEWMSSIRRISQEYSALARSGQGLGGDQPTFARQLQQELRGAQEQSVALTRELGAGLGPGILEPLGRGFSEVFTRAGMTMRETFKSSFASANDELRSLLGSINQFQPAQAARSIAGDLKALSLPPGPSEPYPVATAASTTAASSTSAPVVETTTATSTAVEASATALTTATNAAVDDLARWRAAVVATIDEVRRGATVTATPTTNPATVAQELTTVVEQLRTALGVSGGGSAGGGGGPRPPAASAEPPEEPARPTPQVSFIGGESPVVAASEEFAAMLRRASSPWQQISSQFAHNTETGDMAYTSRAQFGQQVTNDADLIAAERALQRFLAAAEREIQVSSNRIGPNTLTPAEIAANQRAVQVSPNPIGPNVLTPAEIAANQRAVQVSTSPIGPSIPTPEFTEAQRAAAAAAASLAELNRVMASTATVSRTAPSGLTAQVPAAASLDARTLVDSRLPDPRFFTVAGEELQRGTAAYNVAQERYNRQLEQAGSAQLAAANLAELNAQRAAGGVVGRTTPSGATVTTPAVGDLDYKTLFDARLPDPKFFTLAGEELEQGSKEYRAAIASFNRQLEKAASDAQKASVSASGAGGGDGGVFGNFVQGMFSGGFGGHGGASSLSDLSRSFGATVKYSEMYQVLGMVQQALSGAVQEIGQFDKAETDLVATLNTSNGAVQGQINALQQMAVAAGADTSAMMQIAAQGTRVFGDMATLSNDSLKGTQQYADALKQAEAAGNAYAASVEQMSVLADTTLQDAAGNVTAISQAFNIPATGLSRINDVVVLSKQLGGADAKDAAQALTSVAAAAQQAGFSLEQAAVLTGRVQARTDEGGAAVGQRISRFLATAQGVSGQALLTRLLPDTAGESAAQQLIALANAWDTLGAAQQKTVTSQLGGGTSSKEFIAAIQAMKGLDTANLDAAGKGAEEYQARLQDIGRQLSMVREEFSQIADNLGRSGLLAPIGLLIAGVKEILVPLNTMLQLWDRLPEPLKDVLGVAVTLFGTLKAIAAVQAAGGIQQMVFNAEGVVAPTRAVARQALAQTAAAEVGGTVAAASAPAVAFGATTEAAVARAAATTTTAATEAAAVQVGAAEQAGAIVVANAEAQAAAGAAVVAAEGELAAATQGAAASQSATAVRGSVAAWFPAAAARAGVAAEGAAAEGAAASSGLLSGVGGAAKSVLTSPITWAIAGLVAIGDVKDHADQFRTALKQGSDGLSSLTKATTTDDYRNSASSLKQAALATSESGSGFGGLIYRSAANQQSDTLTKQADFATYVAGQIDAQQKLASSMSHLTIYGDPAAMTTESLAAATKSLTDSGASAQEQIDLLDKAFKNFGSGSNAGGMPVDTARRAGTVTTSLGSPGANGSLSQLFHAQAQGSWTDVFDVKDALAMYTQGGGAGLGKMQTPGDKAMSAYQNAMAGMSPDIYKAIQSNLPALATGPGGTLGDSQKSQVADAVAKVVQPKLKKAMDGFGIDDGKLMDLVKQQVIGSLSGKVGTGLAPGEMLSGEQAYAAVTARVQQMQQAVQMLLPGDTTGQINQMKAALSFIKDVIAHTPPDQIGAILAEKAQMEAQLAELQISDLESQRKALQNAAKSKSQIKAIGERYLSQEIALAAQAGDVQALINIIDNANSQEIAAVQATLEASLKVVNEAITQAQHTAAMAAQAGGEFHGGQDVTAGVNAATDKAGNNLTAKQKALQDQLNALKAAEARATPDREGKGVYATGSDSNNPLTKGAGATDTAEQIAAARNAANATRIGGALATSSAAIQTAKANLDAAKKGTVAYYNALASLYSAQQQYADAVLAYQKLQLQAGTDMTDPVKAAQVEVTAAAQKLAADRKRGAGKDVVLQDQVALTSAQNQAEAAAFSQKMSDAQTAEQLGKMSHTAYISFLQGEHNRLSSIKDKTRQQIDELNQVDLALKSAAQTMQGQFNLGDIKIPTVYEVRRYIQQTAQAATTAATASALAASGGNSTSITINGTDTGMVINLLSKYLGPTATQSVAVSANRKV
jgi:hypothetical protein